MIIGQWEHGRFVLHRSVVAFYRALGCIRHDRDHLSDGRTVAASSSRGNSSRLLRRRLHGSHTFQPGRRGLVFLHFLVKANFIGGGGALTSFLFRLGGRFPVGRDRAGQVKKTNLAVPSTADGWVDSEDR